MIFKDSEANYGDYFVDNKGNIVRTRDGSVMAANTADGTPIHGERWWTRMSGDAPVVPIHRDRDSRATAPSSDPSIDSGAPADRRPSSMPAKSGVTSQTVFLGLLGLLGVAYFAKKR